MIPPIVSAALEGNLERVNKLIAEGADVNATTTEVIGDYDFGIGATALMVAAAYGHVDIVTALLEAGADPNQKDKRGTTVLWYVAQPMRFRNNLEVLQAILRHSRYPVDVNIKYGNEGHTPLHLALNDAMYPRKEGIIRLLVESGADLMAKVGKSTPLDNILMQIYYNRLHQNHHLATSTPQLRRIAEFLMNHGALTTRPEANEILKELFTPEEIVTARKAAAYGRRRAALMAFARFQAAEEAAEAGNNNAAAEEVGRVANAPPAAAEPVGGAGAATPNPRRRKNTRRGRNHRKRMSRRRRNY
jgi:hypothetical protein